MLFKICPLGVFVSLLLCTACSDNKKEMEYDELDRMAKEKTESSENQAIAEKEGELEGEETTR